MLASKGPLIMSVAALHTRVLFTAALVGSVVLTGCSTDGGSSDEQVEGAERTVEAANGSVVVPDAPERIAVLWRPTLAAVHQLGHEVVGTMGTPGSPDQELDPFLPEDVEGADQQLVTNSPVEEDLNIEELANTEPDLIIGVQTQVGTQAEMLDSLEAIAPTVLLEWEGTGAWRGHLEEVAEVLDAAEEAEEAVTEYETAVESARQEIAEAEADPAEIELSLVRLQDENEVRLETPESFSGQVVEDLGFARPDSQLADDEETDYIPHSYENLAEADGDAVFVLVGSGFPEAPETFSEGVWSNLDAVQQEEVYRGDHDVWGAASYYAAHSIVEEVTAALTGELDPAV